MIHFNGIIHNLDFSDCNIEKLNYNYINYYNDTFHTKKKMDTLRLKFKRKISETGFEVIIVFVLVSTSLSRNFRNSF